MNKKMIFLISITTICFTLIAACTSETPAPSENAQITKIAEGDNVTGQITQTATFDQCGSSSVFRTEIHFSDSNIQTNQQELVLGAEVTGSGKVYGAVELEIKGSLEQHFSESIQRGQMHGGSVSIEVPAHTKQEYTIIWQETRHTGTVEYTENGQSNSLPYSFRVGLDLFSTFSKDIPCSGEASTDVPSAPAATLPPSNNALSSAAQVLRNYYDSINNARNKDDLGTSWNLLTLNLQCNPNDNCNLAHYQEWWWQWNVLYKLYDCDTNIVDAEYRLVRRNEILSSTPTQLYYQRFLLIEESGTLKINESKLMENIGNNCMLVHSSQ